MLEWINDISAKGNLTKLLALVAVSWGNTLVKYEPGRAVNTRGIIEMVEIPRARTGLKD